MVRVRHPHIAATIIAIFLADLVLWHWAHQANPSPGDIVFDPYYRPLYRRQKIILGAESN